MSLHKTLEEICKELILYKNMEEYLGQDFERPIKSLQDGYPENTANLIGKILESLLKRIWINNKVKGDPGNKTLNDLIKVCSSYIQSREVYDYMIDIQRVRNRASHHGGEVSESDAIESIRKLLKILEWFQSINAHTIADKQSILDPDIQNKVAFIIEFYGVLKYKEKNCYEISSKTAYLLFVRNIGNKYDYVEVFISKSLSELVEIFTMKKHGLFKTVYPKKTRYIITDKEYQLEDIKHSIGDSKISSFESFLGHFLNYNNYYQAVMSKLSSLKSYQQILKVSGQLLMYDLIKQDYVIEETSNVNKLIDKVTDNDFGNLFIISNAGGGKTNICKTILEKVRQVKRDSYVLYFDLGLMKRGETIESFITRQLRGYLKLNDTEIFDVVYFLNKSGYIITLLDGLDELFGEIRLDEILDIFGEISKLFSETSRIIITSRISFFMSSRYIRELLNKNAIVSDKVKFGLTSVGIDPLQLPNFRVLKLEEIKLNSKECSLKHNQIARELLKKHNTQVSCTPLEYFFIDNLTKSEAIEAYNVDNNSFNSAELIYNYIRGEFLKANDLLLMNNFISYFYECFQENKTLINLIELFAVFGDRLFPDQIITFDNMKLKTFFKYIDPTHIKFNHKCFYEFFFAMGFLKTGKLDREVQRITSKIRDYIFEISTKPEKFNLKLDKNYRQCIVPKGYYLVGDYDKVLIKYNNKDILFDEESVTVEQYLQFLDEIKGKDLTEFEHPLQPKDWDHHPDYQKLKIKDYYSNDRYLKYPAICISFFSAYAYAKFYGKRLPTSFEWECASRGKYGSLFSWGDHFDLTIANAADYWAKKVIVDYEEWKQLVDSNEIHVGHPLPSENFIKNVSPFGIKNTCGNIWELSSTIDETSNYVVLCGGSYDNPFRAIKSSSKGIYTLDRVSNAIGFRCCKDLG
ncbi:SUMF1/EgtB/PvdO family nonheme iron enzyme [Paenactinomyces guangxiensis]|uniref:SUMF1/EgtB/PvdO family nonheme iron enzyme n=1 Tax=Paenactinomyces guangxiensis TaxID=1490290 RepID=A0A7W1WUK1_9BACL|nr:SUMF1/EgtB/PvdO family nonheme iron enzyme [Paenactinomyces guangxiensis]MBA4496319.1 SUMF1/EgtB/PvdO family nonheme iron enzyme [Paenactinomyces guangxiensis]MBH8590848.1 SUMF1/EgtB/PvdO family nonheme iron enzyme [Paenactinomyces guangxiensis]